MENSLCRLTRIPQEVLSLQKVRDLIRYEGPILAEYRSPIGEPYLYYWCGMVPASYHRWLIFRVSKRDLVKFISSKLPLLSLIQQLQGERAYLLEIDGNIEHKCIYLLEKSDIPKEYLPGEDSFYDPDLSNVDSLSDEYAMLIDSEWEFKDLGNVPRKYVQMHAFLYWMNSEKQLRPSRAFRYNKAGKGWSVNHFFTALHKPIPSQEKPHLREFQYSSPGFIRMKMDRDMGSVITAAVTRFASESSNLAEHYNDLHSWTKGKKQLSIPEVVRVLQKLVETMGFIKWEKIKDICKETEQKPENQIPELKNVVFSILAYYRLVQRMARYQIDNKISLL